jgi:uncharacterized MnhB-related membrane protein
MNIKYKAILITLAVFFGLFAALYTIAHYPAIIFFAVLGALMYFLYRGVLNHLEYNERFKK